LPILCTDEAVDLVSLVDLAARVAQASQCALPNGATRATIAFLDSGVPTAASGRSLLPRTRSCRRDARDCIAPAGQRPRRSNLGFARAALLLL
jgi:hypothetical protein